MTPRTTWLQRLLLIVGGLLGALFLLELGLRGTGAVLLAWRERADLLRTAKNGEVRILCIGESTTYCGGTKAYPRQLEEILNARGAPRRFTVVNKGIPGTNTTVIEKTLESWIEKHRPDAVVAMMGVNDGGTMMVTPLEEEGGEGERFLKNLRLYKLFTLIREGARRMGGGAMSFLDADEQTAALVNETEKNPRDPAAFLKLGETLLKQEHFERAAEAFRRAGELMPSADAFFGLGMSLKKSADYPRAREAFGRCLEIDPKHDRAWTEAARCCLEQSPKDRAQAEKMFARAIEANPKNDMALAGMAYCRWKKKDFPEAIAFAERSVAANPDNEWAYGTIRSCYKKMRNIPAAIEACERAIAADPRSHWAHSSLANLYAKLGDAARSKEHSRQAREIATTSYNPVTARNYRRVREILAKRKIRLVAMQYPVRSVEPLQRMLAPAGDEVYVSNEKTFREALRRLSPKKIFKDGFGGDFGHCTPMGNYLIADNLARVLLAEIFPARRAAPSLR